MICGLDLKIFGVGKSYWKDLKKKKESVKKMKKKNTNTTFEIVRKMRGDWGNVNPVTKVIPNKKKNPKVKHKGKEFNYD